MSVPGTLNIKNENKYNSRILLIFVKVQGE